MFKKETNYTVVGYLTRYRIHMALKLLRDCRYKIYEVADMVGIQGRDLFRQHPSRADRTEPIGISGQMQIGGTYA